MTFDVEEFKRDNPGAEVPVWEKVSIADLGRQSRANLATFEAEAHRKISEMFAGLRAKLEQDLLLMEYF